MAFYFFSRIKTVLRQQYYGLYLYHVKKRRGELTCYKRNRYLIIKIFTMEEKKMNYLILLIGVALGVVLTLLFFITNRDTDISQ